MCKQSRKIFNNENMRTDSLWIFRRKKDHKLHQDATNCYICGKRILKMVAQSKTYRKERDYCHYTGKNRNAAHTICNLSFNVPNFHNGSNYRYLFIIKQLANKFEGQFECLGKITEKYKTFSVPIKKVLKIDKDGNESIVNIS